jgi:hypothetical protein
VFRVWLALGLVLSGLGTQYFKQEVRFAETQVVAVREVAYVPPPAVLRWASLANPGFMADLMHIRGHQYFVKHMFSDRHYPHLDRYVEAILALDPRIRRLYDWLPMAYKMGPTITAEAVHRSIAIAEEGLRWFPNDWRLYTEIGYNYLFELRSEDPEVQADYQRKGREHFAIAAHLPGSGLDPSFLLELFAQKNENQLALRYFYSVYLDATEEQQKELLLRIRELEAEEAVSALEQRDAEWKRDFPFVDRRFFELLGPVPSLKLDRSWQALDSYLAQELEP